MALERSRCREKKPVKNYVKMYLSLVRQRIVPDMVRESLENVREFHFLN